MKDLLKIHEKDNVATCLRAVKKGERFDVDGKTIVALENIPVFHKMAVADISNGRDCRKYGAVIGAAVGAIKKGAHVHVHNLESKRGRGDKSEKGGLDNFDYMRI